MKLFINTMIAAYQAGKQPPKVAIKESLNNNALEVENIYIPYEDAIKNTLDTEVELYYTLVDTNLISGSKKFSVAYYYADAAIVNPDKSIDDIPARRLNADTFSRENVKVDEDTLISGGTYKTILDLSFFEGNMDQGRIYVEITSKLFNKNNVLEFTGIGYDYVYLVRTELFPLD